MMKTITSVIASNQEQINRLNEARDDLLSSAWIRNPQDIQLYNEMSDMIGNLALFGRRLRLWHDIKNQESIS